MKIGLFPKRLILVLILLAPLVNNINGFMMWKTGVSVLGPSFYSSVALLLFLILLSLEYKRDDLIKNYLLLGGLFLQYVIHVSMYGGWENIRSYIKVFLPLLLYRFLSLHYGDRRETIGKLLAWSMLIWAFFAIVTAVLHIHPSAGEGYYGFINGNNDYVAMLFALFPLTTTWKSRYSVFFYYVAVVLTRSKGLLLLAPMMLFLPKSKKMVLVALGGAGLIFLITVAYYVNYFQIHYGRESKLSPMILLQYLSFGRIHYLGILLGNLGDKPWYEHIFGSGFTGGMLYSGGKDGIEMDLVDDYNIFGIFKLCLTLGFYYANVFFSQKFTWRTKIKFLPLFFYSTFGGHLLFNPISNLVFALVLFVFEGKMHSASEWPKPNSEIERPSA